MHVERTREKKEASGTTRENGSSDKMCVRERERGVRVLVRVSERGLGRFWRHGCGRTGNTRMPQGVGALWSFAWSCKRMIQLASG
jgi:hypothetical protein